MSTLAALLTIFHTDTGIQNSTKSSIKYKLCASTVLLLNNVHKVTTTNNAYTSNTCYSTQIKGPVSGAMLTTLTSC